MKNFINFLPPWVETNIQPAFYDKESGTCLQQTARMYAKVNQLVRIANEQYAKIEEFIAKFVELKDYVEDYFGNLDVQEEINNKLDEMAEDGSLTSLIGEYVSPYLTDMQSQVNHVNDEIDNLKDSYGIPPLVSSSVAGMTDTTKVYVNTSDGKWYYYDTDASEWTIGGTYQSAGDSDNLSFMISLTNDNPTSDKYVVWNTGNLSGLNGLKATDYLPVTPSSRVIGSSLGLGNFGADARGMAWYDKDKNYISGYQYPNDTSNFNQVAPSNAYFCRITYKSTPVITATPKIEDYSSLLIDNIASWYDFTTYAKDKITPDVYLRNNSGTFMPLAGQNATRLIPCIAGTTIRISGIAQYADVRGVGYYDADGTYVSGINYGRVSENKLVTTVPAGVSYLSFTVGNSQLSGMTFEELLSRNQATEITARMQTEKFLNNIFYKGNEFEMFSKILCIGDSLTAGAFNHNEGGSTEYVRIEKYSYPTKLHEKTGIEVTNEGHGGLTTKQIYKLLQNEDLSGYDCCIIETGQNDTTSTETEDYLGRLIDKVQSDNPNGVKIFVTSIVKCYYLRDEGRYNPINNAIKSAVEAETGVYFIPLFTDSICTNGTAYEEGHLTALGYNQMADEIINEASAIIHNNLNDFKWVQFINTDYSWNE